MGGNSVQVTVSSKNGRFAVDDVTDCKCTVLTKLAASARVSSALSSKYGHFWLQKSNIATVKMPNSKWESTNQ